MSEKGLRLQHIQDEYAWDGGYLASRSVKDLEERSYAFQRGVEQVSVRCKAVVPAPCLTRLAFDLLRGLHSSLNNQRMIVSDHWQDLIPLINSLICVSDRKEEA